MSDMSCKAMYTHVLRASAELQQFTQHETPISHLCTQVWDRKYKTEQAAHFMNMLAPDVMVSIVLALG